MEVALRAARFDFRPFWFCAGIRSFLVVHGYKPCRGLRVFLPFLYLRNIVPEDRDQSTWRATIGEWVFRPELPFGRGFFRGYEKPENPWSAFCQASKLKEISYYIPIYRI